MIQPKTRELFYVYIIPFIMAISYGYSWFILKMVSKYLFDFDSTGFWISFNVLVVIEFLLVVKGIMFSLKNENKVLLIIYALIVLTGFGFLLLLGGLVSAGAPKT
jgi:hypothetical protein